MKKMIEIAKKAALEAGKIHMEFFNHDKEIFFKQNEFDLVTNVDRQSEQVICSIIKQEYPEHAFLGEESGASTNLSEYLWIIDPLDGTTNYTHNFPHFAVSIGLYKSGKPLLGVVLDPFKKEMFWAIKGEGAFLNDKKISVSNADCLKKALLATGFPYGRDNILEKNLEYFKKFIYKAQAVRRPGSAALDLCYVASGRLDGFWELNLSPWDVAAGVLIIEEAGGKVTNFNSDKFDYNIKNILATNKKIYTEMQEELNS
ncbi:MAG: inositol monophosphatase family protein [Candidatus Gastranaerophilales bacterium]|nr:inositol monophosphatase family protein [Candidatus Gastranaerophilales bacterium]